MGLENLFNSFVPMTILFVFIIVLFFAMKSKSDGSEILKLFKKKRFLGLEISQAFLALSEGMLAAAIGMELDHVPYGVRLTGHIALICTSAFAGFQLGDQVKEAREADSDNMIKEWADVFWSIILTVLPPFANVAYIAFSLKAYRDINAFFTFDWGRISSALVALTCFIFVIHVVVVLYLATATAGKKEKSNVDSNGGTDAPLTQASDDDDSEDADIDDDKPEIITTLPVPVAFDPEKVNVENYLNENFPHVDKQRLHHRLAVDRGFKASISNLVIEALTHREDWDNQKAIISEAQRVIDTKTRTKEMMEKHYNHDPERTTYKNVVRELKDREEQTKEARRDCNLAEDNYNAALNEIQQELATI